MVPFSARITAISGGAAQPLFDAAPIGTPSPSSTLLVETHTGQPDQPVRRAIVDQVLTLFIEPGRIEHAEDDGPSSPIDIPAGAVVLPLRGRFETVRCLKPVRMTSVRMADSVLEEAAGHLGIGGRPRITPNRGAQSPQLTTLMQSLHYEQATGFQAGALFVDGIERALAALLVSGHTEAVHTARRRMGRLSPARVRRIEDFVEANLAEPLRLADLAALAGYSETHFLQLFRQSFGTTPHRYVQRLRIDRAMERLKGGGPSLVEIALDCGFQTQQHFSRIFRAQTGLSPGEFRRNWSE